MANPKQELPSRQGDEAIDLESVEAEHEEAQSLLFEVDAPGLGAPPAEASVACVQTAANQQVIRTTKDVSGPIFDSNLRPTSVSRQDLQALTVDGPPAGEPRTQPRAEPVARDAGPAHVVSTRAYTHVAPAQSFDVTLKLLDEGDAAIDPRARLAWRFKAVTAAYKMLGTFCPSVQLRTELTQGLREYETTLRACGGTVPAGTKHVADTLHAQLAKSAVDGLDRSLTRLEDKLLSIDECTSDDAFRMRWNKQREQPKTLLRYARFLASRKFNVGFRRDRFEALAHDLLTLKTPNGALALMPRAKAGPVIRQLLRGLPRTSASAEDRDAAVAYLREALDRLQHIAGAKQFFDSGFFMDVHGYKISMHDQVTHPEFLYLCVALNVEIHNRLLAFSTQTTGRASSSGSSQLSALLSQLRQQEQQVQSVFANFRKPVASSAPASAPARPAPKPKSKSAKKDAQSELGARLRLVGAALLLAGAVIGNLYATGVLRGTPRATLLPPSELKTLSPLLTRASLNEARTTLTGSLSRPQWIHLNDKERRARASELADRLRHFGVNNAKLYAYKTRAIEIEFGSVVYVDPGP